MASRVSEAESVINSIRTNGTDTVPPKKTGFLNMDHIAPEEVPAADGSEAAGGGYYSGASHVGSARDLHEKGHTLWSEEHEEQERARRDRRENRDRGHFVADVPEFDPKAHREAWEKEKSTQEKSSCSVM